MTSSIEVMKDLEHVRARHTMYTDGVDHATKEAIDNVIDEYQAGACRYLGISLDTQLNQIVIADKGRGIPVEIHATEGVSKFAVAFTKLHSSGKYHNREVNKYTNTIGLNGVGIKVTSATSEIFEAWTMREGISYKVEVKRGVLVPSPDGTGIIKDPMPNMPFQVKDIVTVLRYTPDATVFGTKYCKISAEYLRELCDALQYLCPMLRIELIIDSEQHIFFSRKGIAGLLDPKDTDIECKRFQIDTPSLNLILWWNPEEDGESILSYVNCQRTKDGGSHVNALRTAVVDAFGDIGRSLGQYVKEGLRCAFHIKIADPQFQGQNKHRLLNPEAADIVQKQVTRNLELFLAENPKIKDAIVQRATALKKAHETFKKDKEAIKNLNKGKSRFISLPDKLISASHCSPKQRELFLCLHGNTKVRLTDGSTPTIKEMAENPTKDYYGFTYDSSNDWIGVTRLLHPRQTQESAELLTITLDNGTSFTCTPDHLILRQDNLMVRADQLAIDTSLRRCHPTLDIKAGSATLLNEVIFYKKTYNHKIVKIEMVSSAPVYCLTVPKTKNFLLANGVFVHNCEGASAANPIIQARTRPLYQEIYMLKGKITNACRAEKAKVLANADIIGIIQSVGCGILDDCDVKKSRVDKILLISDADFDGRHIDALLVSFFTLYMRPMVEAGKIYRVKSPLYVASYRELHWYGTGVSDQSALSDVMQKIPDALKSKVGRPDGVTITRFKGHGAASAEAIQNYALGPTRELERITLPEGDVEHIMSLMGDDVTARKDLLAID